MERLKFIQTWSVNQFKANNHVEQIEIKKNADTGKCFFIYGFETGACSNKIETGELTMPVISEVCSPDTGEMFYLLHQQGESKALTVATL